MTSTKNRVVDQVSSLYLNENFSDVTFMIGEDKLHAHQNILGQRCPVFKQMFLNQEGELKHQTIVSPEVPSFAFKQLLKYIYTDAIEQRKIPAQVVFDLLKLSKTYELPRLEEICVNRLKDGCDISRAGVLINPVVESSHQGLIKYYLEVISRCADTFLYDHFKWLTVKALYCILENGALNSLPSKEVFESLVEWMEAYPQRQRHFLNLLKLIDLKSIKLIELAKIVQPLKFIDSNDLFDILCEQAKNPDSTVKTSDYTANVITDQESTKFASFSDQISDLYLNENFSDVKFIVEGEELLAHRNIVSQRSSLIKANVLEEVEGRIELMPEMPLEAFKQVLKFIYTDSADLTSFDVDTVFIILKFSKDYGIEGLEQLCVGQLKLFCTIDNVGNILNKAVQTSQETLTNYSVYRISVHSSEFVKHESFKNLSAKALQRIFETKALDQPSKEVFYHFVEWMKANPSEKEHFPKLLKHIDLKGIPSTDLALALRPLKLIDGNDIMNVVREQAENDKLHFGLLCLALVCFIFGFTPLVILMLKELVTV